MYDMILVNRTRQYNLYEMRPGYMPKRAGRGGETGFIGQASQAAAASAGRGDREPSQGIDELTAQEKDALVEKLHHGKGDLSPAEWDDFLLDLVDLGLIDHRERMQASGALLALPSPDENGVFHTTVRSQSVTEVFDTWSGDPLAWLDAIDLYLLKECKLAELEGNGAAGLFDQKKSCAKVAQIVKSLLG